jgi:hypothetical protein
MGRKGTILCRLLTTIPLLTNCIPVPVPACKSSETTIVFDAGNLQTRALDPDETLISDISLMIFDEDGNAEECIWLPKAGSETTIHLIKGNKYSIRACANFGYRVYADHISELDEITYHLAYPDEYREGMPMYASIDGVIGGEADALTIHFKRLMAKISLRMDRSHLSDGVTMNVLAARICNCPKMVKICGPSSVTSPDQCFASGFNRSEFETIPLNVSGPDMVSGTVDLYMLENMQGNISPEILKDEEKVFSSNDPRSRICSYIEVELEYMSQSKYSAYKNLIYRFYLGENRNNLDVERNCHYTITISPEDDGLSGDGWRVDKTGIIDRGPVTFAAYPESYIQGNIGDKIHIWCEFTPSQAPFDVGINYMEDDKAEGIYDYEVDADGHGAVLTLTGPGTGLIYMEAGDPINDAALFIIEVNLPDVKGSEPCESPCSP